MGFAVNELASRTSEPDDIAEVPWRALGCGRVPNRIGAWMLSISPTYLLYYLPLIIAISLVFGATRHEETGLILQHSLHTARWISGFMALVFVVLLVMDWMV